MTLKKIQNKQSLRDKAYESLRKALFQGVFKPNQKITEYAVAEALGVSRTPVREALNLFRNQGILKQNPGGSYIFVAPTVKQIEDIFELRHVLETLAAKKIIHNCTEADITRLERLINREQRLLDGQDTSRFFELNMEFRSALFHLCGNERLAKIIDDFMDNIYFVAVHTLEKKPIRRIIIEIHTKIILALRESDETALIEVVNEHLRLALDAIRGQMNQ